MSTDQTTTAVQHAAELLVGMPAAAVAVGQDAVARVHRLWNHQVHHRPAMVVRCRTTADVRTALLAAARSGLRVGVVGGGHDWAGNAVRGDAMLLDLADMRQVTVSSDGTAVAAGGATSSDVLDAARPYGWGAALGTVGSVGAAGLVLGGGLSPLAGVAGLGVDNLLRAEVVLADGSVVTADAEHEPELFWALRGGGGNFGVVTGMELRLHPVSEVTTGVIVFPWSEARAVLHGWRDLMASADDALDVMFGALHTPGGLVLFTSPTWAGAAHAADGQVDLVRALGKPVQDQVVRVPLADTVHALDADYPHGGNYHLSSRTLPGPLRDDAVEAFITAAEAMPAGCVLNVHHIHGAATRVPVSATAYAYRDEHLVVEILGCWTDGDGVAQRSWVDVAAHQLDPHALPGGWTNLMASGDVRADDAYGPNTVRLLAAKRRYDPTDTFLSSPLPGR